MCVKKIKLQEKFIEYLNKQPEQGMGYQVVEIELKNSIILKNRIVFNSTFLQLDKNEKINIEDIVNVKVIINE